jgi:predicted Co/Zn/Cd cation transporter (cation efflux family)
MHSHSINSWRHEHVFLGADHTRNERRTWIVIALTALMMVGEIIAGALFGSMALLADGFHMATHAGALTIAAVAYLYARRHAHNERFTFGTGKLGELAGYSSAVILAIVALLIGFESVMRLTAPVPIRSMKPLPLRCWACSSIWRARGCFTMAVITNMRITMPTITATIARTMRTAIRIIICARPIFTSSPMR